MEPEHTFAVEAQDEALLSRTDSARQEDSSKQNVHTNTVEEVLGDEISPLMGDSPAGPRKRQSYDRTDSYQRAMDEPWKGAHGQDDLPWYKKPSIFWLLPAFFPFCVAFGGLIVPRVYLILDLICKDYLSDRAAKDPNFSVLPVVFGAENPQCRDPHVQSLVAKFNLYSNLLSGLFSAIVAPHLGALSDRIGRKKVLICSSVGGFCMELITIAVGTWPDNISVYWLLLGSLADGLCGSFTTAMALSFAYAADCTSPERRGVAFGYFHATLFSGIALGPIFAGIIIKATNNIIIPFYVALVCHFFFMAFLAAAVPESLSRERQLAARQKRFLKLSLKPAETWVKTIRNYNIFEPLWVLAPTGEGSSSKLRRNLVILASIDTMMFGVAMGAMQILLIYCEYRFGWNAVDASGFISITNITRVLGLAFVLPLLTRTFRPKTSSSIAGNRGSDMLDINIIRGTIVFDLLGYLGFALTPSGTIMVISGIIASFGGIGSPTLQSSMTKHLPAEVTGQVLGAVGLLHALARVIAPTIFNLIYSATVSIYAGIVFLCLGSVFVFVFIISWFLKPNVYFDERGLDDLDESGMTTRDE